MHPTVITVVAGIAVTLALSLLLSNVLYRRKLRKRKREAEDKAKLIIKEAEITAETIKKDKILKMRSECEEESNRKKNLIISNEQKLKQREQALNKEMESLKRKEGELDDIRTDLAAQLEHVRKRREDLDKFNQQKVQILENI